MKAPIVRAPAAVEIRLRTLSMVAIVSGVSFVWWCGGYFHGLRRFGGEHSWIRPLVGWHMLPPFLDGGEKREGHSNVQGVGERVRREKDVQYLFVKTCYIGMDSIPETVITAVPTIQTLPSSFFKMHSTRPPLSDSCFPITTFFPNFVPK